MEVDCLSPEPSPFLVACVVGFLDVVEKHRTEDQAMLNARKSLSCSGFYLACKNGYLDVALTLLETGASIDTRDERGRTPLHIAVNNKNEAMVRMLLEAGANVDSKDDVLGVRPLFIAVYHGSIPLVRMLLDFNANPNTTCRRKTCLEVAIKRCHEDVAQLLREAGATG